MKNFKKVISFLVVMICLVSILPSKSVFANEEKKIYVRVEGINNTIAEGESSGNTVYDAVSKLLDSKGIEYVMNDGAYGKYISSINGLTEGKFGGYDGWMYVIKDGNVINDYMDLKDGCEVVFYYGNFGVTYIPNTIKFNPEVPKENEEFTMTIANTTNDWNTGADIVSPLSDIKVYINDKEYITDENGEIKLSLAKGEYTYKFVDNNDENTIPSVVLTKGIFTFDGENAPTLIYSDKGFDNSGNTSNIDKNIDAYLSDTLNFMKSNKVSSWGAFSLYKMGTKAEEGFIDTLKENLSYGVDDMSPTELESAIVGISSLGYSPYNFEGVDLVKELFNRDINSFYNNDAIFALLTYRSMNISGDYKITEADLVNKILSGYSNGWSWAGNGSDPDMTGAAISALSPYYNGKEISGVDILDLKKKVDDSVEVLKNAQLEDGNIGGTYGPSSETNAFVILGLVSIGIDPSGSEFTKSNGDLLSALLSYKGDNGAFNHNDSLKNNMYATENVFRALIALKDFYNNGTSDYYSSDINLNNLSIYGQETDDETNTNINTTTTTKNNNTSINNSTNKNNNKDSNKIKTEDNNNYAIALSLFMLSAISMIVVNKKKEGTRNEY